MVTEQPAWRYKPLHSLTLGYDHVYLFPGHVVGQWYCLERGSGKLLWDRPIAKADWVGGVSEGVIIATGTLESGPTLRTSGVFGISLETGKLLWESHDAKPDRRTLWGWILSFLPIVYEDHVYALRGHECLTNCGRVLDVRTGRELRRESSKEGWTPFWDDASPARKLYREDAVDCGGGQTLRRGTPGPPAPSGAAPGKAFQLFLKGSEGRVAWTFDLALTGHFIDGNYYSFRYSGGFVYMVVADRPLRLPKDPKKPLIVYENPAHYFLWTLAANTGEIVQKIPLTLEPTTRCRIEDVDEQSLLLTCADSVLCFGREGGR
jgi:outer membrane protein assembly factor BamB